MYRSTFDILFFQEEIRMSAPIDLTYDAIYTIKNYNLLLPQYPSTSDTTQQWFPRTEVASLPPTQEDRLLPPL